MELRPYAYGEDYPLIGSWITDERTHALWCARRFPWPITRAGFEEKLKELGQNSGDMPFVAVSEAGAPVGFLCISPGPAPGECRLKYVVIDPERRGRGLGREMAALAAERSGAETVRLAVFSVNLAARSCYESAGFAVESETEDVFSFREERWGRCDMALRLPP